MRPACCRRALTGKAEVRLNGTSDDQRPLRHVRRRRLQRLGLGRFREQAAGQARSRLPAARTRDGASNAPARRRRRRGAMRPSTSPGSTMSTPRSRISAAQLNLGDAQFAPAAIDATLASGVLKLRVANLGAYGGQANGDLTVDASSGSPSLRAADRPRRRARAAAAAERSPISTSSTARCRRRSPCAPPATASARSCPA